jgi:hypothetical protein
LSPSPNITAEQSQNPEGWDGQNVHVGVMKNACKDREEIWKITWKTYE